MANSLRQRLRARWARWLNRRIPPTPVVHLDHRRIFIFLSGPGVVMVAVVVALFIAGINYANNLLLLTAFLLASVMNTTILHTYRQLSGLTVEGVQADEVYAGDRAGFRLRLSAKPGRQHAGLVIDWEGESLSVPTVAADEEVVLFLPTKKRGRYHPARLRLYSRYPLGLLRTWTWLDLGLFAVVYPRPVAGPMPAGVDAEAGTEAQTGRQPGADEYEGLRRYVPGDSLAHVSWKHLARGRGMHVKEYSQPVGASQWLDWQSLAGMDVESRLSRLCWWVRALSAADQPFGLRLPGVEVAVATGVMHRDHCLRLLALHGQPESAV